MGKRFIRLKEHKPLASGQHVPWGEYIKYCDDSLRVIPYSWSVDEDGFLDTENHFRSGRKMVFVGGSFVESMFELPRHRFSSQVERNLNAVGLNVRILNAGYSGCTTLQIFNLLMNKIYPVLGQGGEVFLFMPIGEISGISERGGYWNSTDRYCPIIPMSDDLGVLPENTDMARGLLLVLLQFCRSFEIKLSLVISPMRVASFSDDRILRAIFRRDRSKYNSFMAMYERLKCVWHEVGKANGVPVVDLASRLAGTSGYFYDMLHLNEHGHSAVSRVLTEHILQREGAFKRPAV